MTQVQLPSSGDTFIVAMANGGWPSAPQPFLSILATHCSFSFYWGIRYSAEEMVSIPGDGGSEGGKKLFS